MNMRPDIKTREHLTDAIAALEMKTNTQKNIISNHFFYLEENLRPVNLIKKHKEIIIIGILGLGSGYIIRRLLMKKSTGFMAKVAGSLIQWGLAGLVSKNAEKIRTNAGPVARRVINRTKPIPKTITIQTR